MNPSGKWRFRLLQVAIFTLRVLGFVLFALSLSNAIAWLNSAQDYESLGTLLQALGEVVSAVVLWLVGRTKKIVHPQEAVSRLDYVGRLNTRLNKQQKFYVDVRAEGRISSQFEGFRHVLNEQIVLEEVQSFDSIEDVIYAYSQLGEPRFVLIGDPGSGKSTILRQVGITLATDFEADPLHEELPFWINLGDTDNPADASELLHQWWLENEKLDEESLVLDLKEGRLWLLLDGLNEMPDSLTGSGSRDSRAKSLKAFIEDYKGPVIVTCRTNDYGPPLDLGLPRIWIKPLDPKRIEEFATEYLGCGAEVFLKALEDEPGRKILAANPLNLHFMLEIYRIGGPSWLPPTRERLFDSVILLRYCREFIIPRDEKDRAPLETEISAAEKRLAMDRPAWHRLAYSMFMTRLTTVNVNWARCRLTNRPWRWVPYIRWRRYRELLSLGLLVSSEYGCDVEFFHQSLRDHFALPLVDIGRYDHRTKLRILSELRSLDETAFVVVPMLVRYFFESRNTIDYDVLEVNNEIAITLLHVCYESDHISHSYDMAIILFSFLILDIISDVLQIVDLDDLGGRHSFDLSVDLFRAETIGQALMACNNLMHEMTYVLSYRAGAHRGIMRRVWIRVKNIADIMHIFGEFWESINCKVCGEFLFDLLTDYVHGRDRLTTLDIERDRLDAIANQRPQQAKGGGSLINLSEGVPSELIPYTWNINKSFARNYETLEYENRRRRAARQNLTIITERLTELKRQDFVVVSQLAREFKLSRLKVNQKIRQLAQEIGTTLYNDLLE